MPRAYPHSHLCSGQLVGFSVKRLYDGTTYFACFRCRDGRRTKRDTNQTRLAQAIEASRAILEEEYAPVVVVEESVNWDQALERFKARLATSGNRPGTSEYYLKLIRHLRKLFPKAGPADITPAMAAKWRDTTMTTPGRRKKLPSAHYVAGMIVGFSSLWEKWFKDDLKIVSVNPWQGVKPPKADKLAVKYATDEMIEHFYSWVAKRFGPWPFPKLFLSTKAYTDCRLMDLCSLKPGQLRDGRLIFPPDLTKGRKERSVPLPADLFKALDVIRGEVWLWENYIPGLRTAIAAKGWPTHQRTCSASERSRWPGKRASILGGRRSPTAATWIP